MFAGPDIGAHVRGLLFPRRRQGRILVASGRIGEGIVAGLTVADDEELHGCDHLDSESRQIYTSAPRSRTTTLSGPARRDTGNDVS